MYVSQRTLHFLFAASLVCGARPEMEAATRPSVSTQLSNTHPLARPEFDRGEAPSTLPMNRMLLVLKRSPEQEIALNDFLAALQDKRSPNFHRWLTPEKVGEQYGPSEAELQEVTSWLASEGFMGVRPSKGRVTIEFSGTAQQVQTAFHTAIHKYLVKGEEHWANDSDPVIPAAFSNFVTGIAMLNDFRPKSDIVLRPERALARLSGHKPRRQVNFPDGSHALSPRDFDAIYEVDALTWEGNGTTIAVVSDSNIDVQNVAKFRTLFGDASNLPTVIVNGTDPGPVYPDEPILDVSWAGGIAMEATIDLVVSKQTNATSGIDLSEQYIVDNNFADIVTESYSGCEADIGSAEMQFLSSIRQQAAAQGMTFIVSAGDNGSAGCDATSEETASGPLSVNGRASSPYDVAVGGTQFNESICPVDCWGDTETLVTAFGYIPENVWNQSCDTGNCPGSVTPNIYAGSGGASTIFSKPIWQMDAGVPDDGARDVPDVSFSSSIIHDPYVVCLELTDCISGEQGVYFHLIGGTSAAAPSFAGIVAQLVESNGSRLGQINPALYALEWQDSLTDCNGSTNTTGGNAIPCNFNDITVGNNSVPGQSGYGSSSAPYQAGRGYDLATGLGSVNASRVIQEWSKSSLQRTKTSLSVSPQSSIAVGAPIWITVTVDAAFGGGPPTGQVAVSTPAAPGTTVVYLQLSNGSASRIVNSNENFPFGNYALTATYLGDGIYGPSASDPIDVSFINVLNGCAPTLFTYSLGPIDTNSITASAYIEANVPCGYDIRVGGPDGTLFTTMSGYSSSYAENWVTNGMIFYMQQQGNTTPQGTMASLVVNFGSSTCLVWNFSASPLDQPVWDWFPGTTLSVDTDCAYDVREGGPSGQLVGSGTGAQSYTVPTVPNGTIFCLQPQGDTNGTDTLAIVTAHTPSRQQGPVMPFCIGPDKRYCY